jgi:hypothetical protein
MADRHRLARAALALYPRWWRERYSEETELLVLDLLEDGRNRAGVAIDLVRGAIDARRLAGSGSELVLGIRRQMAVQDLRRRADWLLQTREPPAQGTNGVDRQGRDEWVVLAVALVAIGVVDIATASEIKAELDQSAWVPDRSQGVVVVQVDPPPPSSDSRESLRCADASTNLPARDEPSWPPVALASEATLETGDRTIQLLWATQLGGRTFAPIEMWGPPHEDADDLPPCPPGPPVPGMGRFKARTRQLQADAVMDLSDLEICDDEGTVHRLEMLQGHCTTNLREHGVRRQGTVEILPPLPVSARWFVLRQRDGGKAVRVECGVSAHAKAGRRGLGRRTAAERYLELVCGTSEHGSSEWRTRPPADVEGRARLVAGLRDLGLVHRRYDVPVRTETRRERRSDGPWRSATQDWSKFPRPNWLGPRIGRRRAMRAYRTGKGVPPQDIPDQRPIQAARVAAAMPLERAGVYLEGFTLEPVVDNGRRVQYRLTLHVHERDDDTAGWTASRLSGWGPIWWAAEDSRHWTYSGRDSGLGATSRIEFRLPPDFVPGRLRVIAHTPFESAWVWLDLSRPPRREYVVSTAEEGDKKWAVASRR